MVFDPVTHRRRSIRLKDYDYSQPGKYFVTICVNKKKCLFGEIINYEMRLNDAGKMIEKWWYELSNKFKFVILDKHITMPNHFHGIVIISDLQEITTDEGIELGEIIQWFKTMSTNDYIHGVKALRWERFEKKLWQRNYYEHIVRDSIELNNIRCYIELNPAMWQYDRDNPEREFIEEDFYRNKLSRHFNLADEEVDFLLEFDPYQ